MLFERTPGQPLKSAGLRRSKKPVGRIIQFRHFDLHRQAAANQARFQGGATQTRTPSVSSRPGNYGIEFKFLTSLTDEHDAVAGSSTVLIAVPANIANRTRLPQVGLFNDFKEFDGG